MCVSHSVMSDSATPWTGFRQAPLSMKFPRQEYWNQLPFPPPGDIPNPGIKLASPELSGRFFTTEPSWGPQEWPQPAPLPESLLYDRGDVTAVILQANQVMSNNKLLVEN